MTATGEIPQLSKTEGRDNRQRTTTPKPARRTRRQDAEPVAAEPEPEAEDPIIAQPEESEPQAGNGYDLDAATPQSDPAAAGGTKEDATDYFLYAVRFYAREHGLSTDPIDLINAGREWLMARVGWDAEAFHAPLDAIEAGEIQTDRAQEAADRMDD
jgi:hypothetical protein